MSNHYITRRKNSHYDNQLGRGEDSSSGRDGGRGSAFAQRDGERDYFQPRTDVALWWAFCPQQSWTSEIYVTKARSIETFENHMYFAYVLHMIAMGQNRFNRIVCSAGAEGELPCLGCGVRSNFFKWLDEETERLGAKPDKKPPVGRSENYAFAGVLLEHIGKVQKVDKSTGKLVFKKDRTPLMLDEPLTAIPVEQAREAKAKGQTTFGRSMHWSMGIDLRNQVRELNKKLANYCANCAEKLYAYEHECPECHTRIIPVHQDIDEGLPLIDQTLTEERQKKYVCPGCSYEGQMDPAVECSCGNPLEGTLMDFAVRLKVTKSSDKRIILEHTDVRVLRYFTEKYPTVQEMLDNPLPIDKIFAPTELNFQKPRLPERLRGDGVTASPRRRQNAEQLVEDYALGGHQGGGGAPADDGDDHEFEA